MTFFIKPSEAWGMFSKYLETRLCYQESFDKTNENHIDGKRLAGMIQEKETPIHLP